ncbi:uncharacterized protein BX663DRAFT_428418, partial [Cokeromyces recurvatus]|uniref:uncharacterized protein n=1 Tax=Cokeromyces recurvatus TaxID=90255 RepID=UPI00221EEFCF
TACEIARIFKNDDIFKLLGGEKNNTLTHTTHGSPFPENYTTVFAGNPLNRFGWKRDQPEFLSILAHSPKSKYLILNDLKVLFNNEGTIHYAQYKDLASIVNLIYTKENSYNPSSNVALIFLGIDESQGQGEEGEAYWALDLTPKEADEKECKELIQVFEANGFEFCSILSRAFTMEKSTSAIIAQAIAMVDWNSRNKYCPGCGKRTISNEGGYKRSCPKEDSDDKRCISHKGIQNFSYPRTGKSHIIVYTRVCV